MDHGDVVDHVLSLDVPGDGISISMAIGVRWYRGYHRMLCTAVAMAIQLHALGYIMALTGRDPRVPWMLCSTQWSAVS